MKRKLTNRCLAFLLGVLIPFAAYADWYEATGKPVQRSLLNSGDLRTEFASIESDISDKLPTFTGNGGKIVAVNSGGTALEALASGVAVASGGTGATTAATARTNLGLAIGTDVQAFDADLAAFAALANTDSNFVVGNGSAWVAESGATVRTSLGLGSIAVQSTISNSDWSGTDLAVANGGTGASDASTARSNLGLGSLATLSTISGSNWSGTDLAVTNGGTGSSTASGARSNLGLGSLATLSTVSNSNWSGTDLALVNGGTGASDASTARTNLGVPATSAVVLDTGTQTIAGAKTFSSTPIGPDGGGFLSHANTANNSGTVTVTTTAPASTAGSLAGDVWLVY